jgi:hypothetical protein
MMGFDIGHTACEPSAMPSSRSAPKPSVAASSAPSKPAPGCFRKLNDFTSAQLRAIVGEAEASNDYKAVAAKHGVSVQLINAARKRKAA